MTNHLYVHDWEEHQTYRKDRGPPPWIKLQRHLLSNLKFLALTDVQKWQLIAIWMIAAGHDGRIVNDPVLITKICHLDDQIDLNVFIELGFLDAKMATRRQPRDNHVTSARQPFDATVTPSRAREKQKQKQKKKKNQNSSIERDNTSAHAREADPPPAAFFEEGQEAKPLDPAEYRKLVWAHAVPVLDAYAKVVDDVVGNEHLRAAPHDHDLDVCRGWSELAFLHQLDDAKVLETCREVFAEVLARRVRNAIPSISTVPNSMRFFDRPIREALEKIHQSSYAYQRETKAWLKADRRVAGG